MKSAINQILNLAKSRNGYLEKSWEAYIKDPMVVYELKEGAGKDNVTECWEDVRKTFQGNAWCCCFVYWLFNKCFGEKVAKDALYLDNWEIDDPWKNFDCTSWAQNFENNGARYQSSKAKVGDIIYFTNGKRVHHTGLVIMIKDGYVYTVEGNTNAEDEVIPNGGMIVYGKKYKLGIDKIYCYGRPNWNAVGQSYPVISQGYKDSINGGTYCAELQDSLNRIGIRDNRNNMLKVDGSCGPRMHEAICNFQSKYSLIEDGYFGPQCWNKLNEILDQLKHEEIRPGILRRIWYWLDRVLVKIFC